MYIMGARYDSGVLAVRNFPFFVYLIKKHHLRQHRLETKLNYVYVYSKLLSFTKLELLVIHVPVLSSVIQL